MPSPRAVPWIEWIMYLKSIPCSMRPSTPVAPGAVKFGRREPSVASVLWQIVHVVMSPVRLLPWRLRLKWQALHLSMLTTVRRGVTVVPVTANAFETLLIGMRVTVAPGVDGVNAGWPWSAIVAEPVVPAGATTDVEVTVYQPAGSGPVSVMA